MSLPSPSQGRKGIKPWSQLGAGEKTAVIAVLVVPVLCCGGLLAAINGDDDPDPDRAAVTTAESATSAEATTAAESPSPDPTTAAEPTEKPEPEPEPEVYYENCDAAEDAGVAPLYEDEPGYRAGLDGDGDGEACEGSSSSGSGGGDDDSGDSGDSGDDSGGDDSDDGGDVYYKNCDAVRAAGAAPIHAGDPGYGSHLDRDGDGVACE